MLKLMNAQLRDGDVAIAYVPINGVETRTTVVVDGGALYAKLPGADAGVVKVDPATVYVVSP